MFEALSGDKLLPFSKPLAQRPFMNAATLLFLTAALGVEPWASQDLKVTDGLVVWLDAPRLNEARRAHELAPLKNGDKLAAWYDASASGRTVTQSDEKAQPTWRDGAVRFNGENNFLDNR